MGLLLTLLFGAIAGMIASSVMRSSNGMLMDIVLGIVGSFVGSWVMSLFGQTGTTGFNIWSLFVSVVGAIVVIALGRMITGHRTV
jgi:uncharacterized membrane protein YeaQ/YmgE (transglycosylase-associated protein family)